MTTKYKIGELISVSFCDEGRCIYKDGLKTKKVVYKNKHKTENLRILNPRGEYETLCKLSSYKGFPKNVEYYEDDKIAIISYDFIDGVHIDKLQVGTVHKLTLLLYLSLTLFKLSRLGYVHRDLLARNVLIDTKGDVFLIDFDQSDKTTFFRAVLANYAGLLWRINGQYGSLLDLSEVIMSDSVSNRFFKFLIKIRDKIRITLLAPGANLKYAPPVLPKDAPKHLVDLSKAWDLARYSDSNSPGVPISYYELIEGGYTFPGERPWTSRWELLRKALNYENKRIVELGCNMSLLSCHLLKFEKAQSALCVDINAQVLASAQLLSSAYNVNPIYIRIDFDQKNNWENDLNWFCGDIVFALNVLNWIDNKQRFLNFLAKFNIIIFEGHDTDEIEINRFSSMGFKYNVLGKSERERTIFKFVKLV